MYTAPWLRDLTLTRYERPADPATWRRRIANLAQNKTQLGTVRHSHRTHPLQTLYNHGKHRLSACTYWVFSSLNAFPLSCPVSPGPHLSRFRLTDGFAICRRSPAPPFAPRTHPSCPPCGSAPWAAMRPAPSHRPRHLGMPSRRMPRQADWADRQSRVTRDWGKLNPREQAALNRAQETREQAYNV